MQLQPDEKQALLSQFQELSDINEKIDFWAKKLKSNYFFYVLSFSNYADHRTGDRFNDLHEFKINPVDKSEVIALNTYLLNFYRVTKRPETYKSGATNFDLQLMIETLNRELEEANNKLGLLEIELNNVNAYIVNRSQPDKEHHSQFNAYFTYGYKNYFLDQKEVDISKSVAYDFQDMIAEMDGVVVGKYQEYVKVQIEEVKNDKPRKIEPLSLEQQYLVLDYLDVLDTLGKVKDDNNTRKGQFVSLLISKDFSNCRKQFSYIPSLKMGKTTDEKKKIKKNLTRVRDLFEEIGLKSIAKKVEVDLKSISQ